MAALAACPAAAADNLTVTSPDGHLAVTLALDNQVPTYSVSRDGTTLITPSRLGFAQRNHFANGITNVRQTEVDETYTLPHGKRSTRRNHCQELTVTLDNPGDADLDVVLRVYDDAVAFRYVLPQQGGLTEFADEQTEFNFSQFASALAMDYTPDYSTHFGSHSWGELSHDGGYNEPMLVDMGSNGYALLTEADQTASMAGSRIVKGSVDGQLKLQLYATSNFRGFPFSSPWRTLILGDLATIVESSAVDNLCPASVLADDSWVHPGCVTWNWGGQDMDGTATESVWKRYVDFAAHLGWRYCLMDEGWQNRINMPAFVSYCQKNRVEPLLWFHQNNFPADYSGIRSMMQNYATQGIKGLKIDFFDGDTQDMFQKYTYMLKAAADLKLLLNFHGCTRPTGWERTYPHLLTMEAVFGGEMNLDWHHIIPASHQTNLVVTRNVIGPMDFTPGKIAEHTGKIVTFNSWCNDMATMILFESGLQCLTDCPENISYSAVDALYRQLPAGWDDIRCLEASPGRYATLARRSGDNWYVGSVSADSRVATMKLSFLNPDSTYYAYVYQEGNCRYNVDFELRSGITSNDVLQLPVSKNGGAVVVLSPSDQLPQPQGTAYEAEAYARFGGLVSNDANCSGQQYLTGVANTTRATITRVNAAVDGEYAVTIYHKLDSRNTAYLQVGNSGTKNYYTFETLDDNDNSRGLQWAIKTVYVKLKAGRNILYYGNENGVAPSIDKIVVTPTLDTQTAIASGIRSVAMTGKGSANEVNLWQEGNSIVCELLSASTLDLFSLDGRRLYSTRVQAGMSRTTVPVHGAVIASVNTGQQGYARKMVFE